jgi:stearoyl-CoA desaturase (delta-9 desaturase)
MATENKPPLIWVNIVLFLSTFIAAVVLVPLYGYFVGYSPAHFIWLVICFTFCGMSITAGYHRLWAHKAYEASKSLRYLYALGGAFALQNSALHWSSDHRVHHKHVDNNDKDPYSAKRGFWYSHIGWMLREYQSERYSDYRNCRDLQKDDVVTWQHKYYIPLALAMNFGIPILLGFLHGDIIGMLLVVGVLRLVLSHHTTFFINSLAHLWGSQPYTNKNTAKDNGLLAFFTFGEGYHNYHHIFENDYRNGIYWWQFDPTKWFIKAASWVKLTTKLKKAPANKIELAKAKQTLQNTQRSLATYTGTQQALAELEKEFSRLTRSVTEFYETKKHFLQMNQQGVNESYERSLVAIRLEQAKHELILQRKQWQALIHLTLAKYSIQKS